MTSENDISPRVVVVLLLLFAVLVAIGIATVVTPEISTVPAHGADGGAPEEPAP